MLPTSLLSYLVFSCFVLPLARAAVQLSPAPLSVSARAACPQNVRFTCVSGDSSTGQLWWWLNGDPLVSYTISPNSSSSYPALLVVPDRFRWQANVTVTVDSVQSTMQGYNWTSKLSLDLVPGALLPRSNISCGDGTRRNTTTTITCTLPQVVPFLQSPSNSTCNVEGSATFLCQPPPSFTNVSWEVSGSTLRITDTVPAQLYQLQVKSCQEDWKDAAIQCVARRGNTKVYSKTAYLSVNDSNRVERFLIDEEQEIFAFVVGVAVAILVLCCCMMGYCVCHFCCRKKATKRFVQLQEMAEVSSTHPADGRRVSLQVDDCVGSESRRREQRLTDMRTEKKEVLQVMKGVLGNVREDDILECGSRLQKYSVSTIISVAVKPTTCAMNLGLKERSLGAFLNSLQHPNVHRICSIKHKVSQGDEEEGGRSMDFVIVTQPVFGVSLRDVIRGETNPFKDWESKYENTGTPLPAQKVSMFGHQILQAILYLYEEHFEGTSLRPLGHVQSGNIFVKGDQCKLGGYDNTLLGYRSAKYSSIASNGSLDYMDVIMFGYVMYEMCTGCEVQGLLPTDDEYTAIEDVKCGTLLQYIFSRKDKSKTSFKHSIHEISKHAFFRDRVKLSEGNLLGRLKGQLHTGKHTFTRSLDTAEDQRYLVTREDD